MNRLNSDAHVALAATTPRASFGAALVVTSLSTFVAMLAYSGPLGNAPALGRALGASPGAQTWILSSMSVGLAVSLLTAGSFADRNGRRRVFVAGAGVFTAGSVICAVATVPVVFVAGRLIEGVGAAGMIATGLGLVATVTKAPAQRSRSAAWWGTAMGLGIAGGPLLTGIFDLAGAWSTPYWLLAAAGAGIAVAARGLFPETAADRYRRPDLVGAVLLTAGLVALLVALVEARQSHLTAALVGTALAVCTLAGFVVSQLRGRFPMVDPPLFRRGDFVAANAAAVATGAGVIALMSFACTFLATAMGLTSLQAGAVLTLWSGSSAVSAVLVRGLAARVTGTAQLAVGLAVTGIGLLLLTGLEETATVGRLVPGLLVAGLATGVLNAGLARQAVATVPPERTALGTGITNTARYLAASIGVTVVSVLAASPKADTATQLAGWNHVAVLTGALTLAGAVSVPTLAARSSPRERNAS
ncbi:MFS transporter [Halostreptopolyspora alba]|uniref:MFS transporter n=1 Tax=Halostreptopolyspora alba TaxID=2487137 RepID=UPI00371D61B0